MLIVIKKTYPINMNYSKIIKQFLSLKIFVLTLYAPIILAANFCPVDKPGPATYTWTEATRSVEFSARYEHTSVVFDVAGDGDGKKMWVIGGQGSPPVLFANDVWSSTNGATWTEVKSHDRSLDKDRIKGFSLRSGHASVVFENKMWVIGGGVGGALNDVWSSTNGATWTTATDSAAFSARSNHSSVVFDDGDGNGKKMWVIGGNSGGNEVWSSTNGATWTEETAGSSAKFSARHSHTSVVFDDKMWVIGGNGSSRLNDVWKSTNGVTWTTATDSAAFSVRNGHTSVVFDNKMWVIGGNDGDGKNDVWSSADGITWTYEIKPANFPARYWHTSVVFDDKVWVLSGEVLKGDVWSMVRD
jgi:dihydrofolate reductase